jgi:hypothetical protein
MGPAAARGPLGPHRAAPLRTAAAATTLVMATTATTPARTPAREAMRQVGARVRPRISRRHRRRRRRQAGSPAARQAPPPTNRRRPTTVTVDPSARMPSRARVCEAIKRRPRRCDRRRLRPTDNLRPEGVTRGVATAFGTRPRMTAPKVGEDTPGRDTSLATVATFAVAA